MAKICTNCGSQNEDSTLFCTNCGTSLQAPAPQPTPQPAPEFISNYEQQQPTPEHKPTSKLDEILAKLKLTRISATTLGIFAIAAIVVIVAVSILISAIFPGPKKVVKKYLNGLEKGDAKAVVNCMPSYLWEDDKDEKEEFIDSLEDSLDYLEIESIDFKIKDVEKLDKDDQEDYEEMFEYMEKFYDDFDAKDVSAFREVKVKVTVELEDDKQTNTVKFLLIKYKGQWKIFNAGGLDIM